MSFHVSLFFFLLLFSFDLGLVVFYSLVAFGGGCFSRFWGLPLECRGCMHLLIMNKSLLF